MHADFGNLTTENLADEHVCCIIRSKKPHPGIDAKRQWLSNRLQEGHIFRKLNAKATVFKGTFETVNLLLDVAALARILKK